MINMRWVANKLIYISLLFLIIALDVYIAQLLYRPRGNTIILNIPRHDYVDYQITFPSLATILVSINSREQSLTGEVSIYKNFFNKPVIHDKINSSSYIVKVDITEPGIYTIRIRNILNKDISVILNYRYLNYRFNNVHLLLTLAFIALTSALISFIWMIRYD